jgi:hypothetical protein
MENGNYVALKDLPTVKYTFQLGGGIGGRTVKIGDIITVIGVTNDIDSKSVQTMQLLNRIELNSFMEAFELATLDTVKNHLANGNDLFFNNTHRVAQVNYQLSSNSYINARLVGQAHHAMLAIRDLNFVHK